MDEQLNKMIKIAEEGLLVQKEMLDYMKGLHKEMREVKVRLGDALKKMP